MKKFWVMFLVVVTFFALSATSASAVTNDTVKVGLRYGSGALFSANLENAVGSGYDLGYYTDSREFISLGWTDETTISMTAAGGTVYIDGSGTYSSSAPGGRYQVIGAYHIQLDETYARFDAAASAAQRYGGYPAYLYGSYAVRIGSYTTRAEAESALAAAGIAGSVVQSSSTGVLVTVTKTSTILFEFDCYGALNLGVQPDGRGSKSVTWFKGYRYYGGFEYARVTGGSINVINVVDLEDYVKGVVPYEMSGSWPLAALEAQAVCARTYTLWKASHGGGHEGADVCTDSSCCQAYITPEEAAANWGDMAQEYEAKIAQAVAATDGMVATYEGAPVQAVFFSSSSGATEDAAAVWGSSLPYLVSVDSPEGDEVPNYHTTVTLTADQVRELVLAAIPEADLSGDPSGWFSELSLTASGRVAEVKVGGVALSGGAVRNLFGLRSACFQVEYGESGFTFSVTGYGHGVGMSQYGANAMAQAGSTWQEILTHYYTGVTLEAGW